jgi:hypothetical protein
MKAIEAVIDADGFVHLKEDVNLPGPRRAIVTILDEQAVGVDETAVWSEQALAVDWDRPEEDEAWSHLQQEA